MGFLVEVCFCCRDSGFDPLGGPVSGNQSDFVFLAGASLAGNEVRMPASKGDTLDDGEVLELLKKWNASNLTFVRSHPTSN